MVQRLRHDPLREKIKQIEHERDIANGRISTLDELIKKSNDELNTMCDELFEVTKNTAELKIKMSNTNHEHSTSYLSRRVSELGTELDLSKERRRKLSEKIEKDKTVFEERESELICKILGLEEQLSEASTVSNRPTGCFNCEYKDAAAELINVKHDNHMLKSRYAEVLKEVVKFNDSPWWSKLRGIIL